MTKVFACLLGKWVCLNDDPKCKIDDKDPYIWWEEGAEIYSPANRKKENSFYELDYVHISFNDKTYRGSIQYLSKLFMSNFFCFFKSEFE